MARADPDEFVRLVEQATDPERWGVAGNYATRPQALAWDRADQVIWLDYPLRVSFWGLLRRTIRRWRDDVRTGTVQATRELVDVEARLRDMDELNIDVQVLYPTLFLLGSRAKFG
mgnify:CR=1 FL=1